MADQNKTEVIYRPTTTDYKKIKLGAELEPKQYINFTLYFAVVSVNLLAFAVGNTYGWSSTVLIDLESNDTAKNPLGRSITPLEGSWIVSLVNLSAAAGTAFAGYGSKKFRKKKILLLSAIPVMMSHIILMFANRVGQFLVARLLMGLGIGFTNTIVPLYVAEISEIHIRGLLGCFMALQYSIGLLYVFVIGAFFHVKTLSAFLIIPVVLFFCFFGYYCPESPYYFLSNGDMESAKKSLRKLRNNDSSAIAKELADIRQVLQESNIDESLMEALKGKQFRKALSITVALMYFQQFVGVTVITSYMETILTVAGGAISSATSSIIIGIITFLSILLSLFLIDTWGRKILLVISSIGCAISLSMLGIFFYMKNCGLEVTHLTWLPLLSLIGYTISFSLGIGPIPWALNGEFFSNKTKELASSFICFVCLVLAFVTALIFPILRNVIGLHGSFWFFAVNALICMVFVLRYVPETKGKTFQEILKILER